MGVGIDPPWPAVPDAMAVKIVDKKKWEQVGVGKLMKITQEMNELEKDSH